MSQFKYIILAVSVALEITSCGTAPTTAKSENPHATVTLRDGTRVKGSVTASSPDKLTLQGDDKITREIPTSEVKSVAYEETRTAATQPAPQTVNQAQVSPAPAVTKTPAEQPPVITKVLPAGSKISVRTNETIDSGKASEGQVYSAEVTRDIHDAAGDVLIPRGTDAQIVIRSASKGGRFRGTSDLVLDLDAVKIAGREYKLDTADIEQKGRDGFGVNKRTGIFSGGGAAVGAIIGGIADGGKGAAIGAGAGAGAGALTQVLTKGKSIKIPAETVLTFTLEAPLRVRSR